MLSLQDQDARVRAHIRELNVRIQGGQLMAEERERLKALVAINPTEQWNIWSQEGELQRWRASELGFEPKELPALRWMPTPSDCEDQVLDAILRYIAVHTEDRLSEEYVLMQLHMLSLPPALPKASVDSPSDIVAFCVDLVTEVTAPLLRRLSQATARNAVKKGLMDALSRGANAKGRALDLRREALRWQRELAKLTTVDTWSGQTLQDLATEASNRCEEVFGEIEWGRTPDTGA
ncbi:MAG: hypothetical protein H6740_28585 [Alphaproteobacteria bacterium]|nr:hypothetical protein [Alphaproteobacteria bacterium]